MLQWELSAKEWNLQLLASINWLLENAEELRHDLIPIMQTFRSIPHDQRDAQVLKRSYSSMSKLGQTFISKRRQKGEEEYIYPEENPTLIHYPGTPPTRELYVQIPMYLLHRNEGLTQVISLCFPFIGSEITCLDCHFWPHPTESFPRWWRQGV